MEMIASPFRAATRRLRTARAVGGANKLPDAPTEKNGITARANQVFHSVADGWHGLFEDDYECNDKACRVLGQLRRAKTACRHELGERLMLSSRQIGCQVAELLLKAGSKQELVEALRSEDSVKRMADRLWPEMVKMRKCRPKGGDVAADVTVGEDEDSGDESDEEEDDATTGLANALAALDALEPSTPEWAEQRATIATLLRQGNTYVTWSISLKDSALRDSPLLYAADDDEGWPSVTPSALGVHADSSLTSLKTLDLGGGDQRKVFALLDRGELAAAEGLLVKNKKGAANRCYILTGGPLERRHASAARLRAAFPLFTFVAVHPEVEGRLTLRSAGGEVRRLLASSNGRLSHALLVAKGSTDVHFVWMDGSGNVAADEGNACSRMHRVSGDAPSTAKELFLDFMQHPANAPLLAAAQAGRLAILLAGSSLHVLGVSRAVGNYLKRVSRAELEAAPAEKAEFERYLTLEWNDTVVARAEAGGGMGKRMDVDATAQAPPTGRNLVFVGS